MEEEDTEKDNKEVLVIIERASDDEDISKIIEAFKE
jgi:hypothetical protein